MTAESSSQPEPQSPRRDEGGTTQISLRLPEGWMRQLRRRAANASTTEDRMISPQEIVRRILRRELEQG